MRQAQFGPAFVTHSNQGYLGVTLRDVADEQVSVLKLKEAKGAEVLTVDHDAPAGKAGLQEHDVILQMNGQAIEGAEQLRRMLHETPPGHTVTLAISRDGQPQTITAQLADRSELEKQVWELRQVPEPPDADDNLLLAMPRGSSKALPQGKYWLGTVGSSAGYSGANVDPLGPQLADFFGVKARMGLLVKSVESNSPASNAGLKAGDVIVKVNQDAMVSPKDWAHTIRENHGKQVQITIVRDRKEQTLNMTAGEGKNHSKLEQMPGALQLDLDGPDTEDRAVQLAQLQPLIDGARVAADQARVQIDSPEFREQMEQAGKQLREEIESGKLKLEMDDAKGLLDNPQFHEQMDAMKKELDGARLQQDIQAGINLDLHGKEMQEQMEKVRQQMDKLRLELPKQLEELKALQQFD